MRYPPEHKAEVHRKIVKDAARRIRAEGLQGAAVAAVMRDTGLTHGGFYKHFPGKDELLRESLRDAFHDVSERLSRAAQAGGPKNAWKAIVQLYLSPEHCDHAELGCPLAALASEFTRVPPALRRHLVAELEHYKDRVLPYMPGRRSREKQRAFFVIFSTMVGALSIARILPDRAARLSVLSGARDFLFRSF